MRRRLGGWIVVSVALGIGLGWVPLFDVLGYELALAIAVLAAVCGLDLGAALARSLQATKQSAYAGRMLARTTVTASVLAIGVALIPGVICAIRGLWTPTCDWWFGIVAYVAMPLATAALAGALGHAIGVAVGSRRRRRWYPHRSTVLAQLPIAVLAAAGLWRFYSEPPVFVYNAIIGYFPGNLYDETIHLGAAVAWSRLEQLLWVLAIVAAVATRLDVPRFRVVLRGPHPDDRRIAAIVLAIACAAGAITLHHFGGALGYAVDTDDIEEVLDGRIETAHFVIHYARTPEIEKDIALIAADHEFRYSEVVGQLGVAPAGKLGSFYFATPEQKVRWFGAHNVEMTKPWRREIYLDHRAFPHSSLRHEIAHAVASEFGDPIFGVAARRVLGLPVMISPGLIEGLAVAIDWPGDEGRLTPHESVRALQLMGLAPSIADLLSIQFLTVSSARGYTTAGSFLKFLLDTYGAPALRAVYHSGGDFEAAYGKPLAALEAEWSAMISAIQLPADVVEGTREKFRAGGVFSRPCPHAIAERHDRAVAAAASGDRPRAISLMRVVCGDAPEEPRHRMELGDLLSGGTPAERAEALALWAAIADDAKDVTSTVRAQAMERLARAAAVRSDLATTTAMIDRAHVLPVDANTLRMLDAEALSLHHEGPAGAALRGYFFASPNFPLDGPQWALLAIAAEPDLGIAHYLLGLQKNGDWPAQAAELDLALDKGLPNAAFVRNAARKLAVAAYRSGDATRVRRAIATLRSPGMAETDRLLADDWERRLAFAHL